MTTAPAIQNRPAPDQQAAMKASMRDLLRQPIDTTKRARQVSQMVEVMTVPADRKWIAGRVMSLLSQYFASSMTGSVMEAIAEDWIAELKGLPSWAIQDACRWWMSRDNPDRRKKPMPGDISARARHEMGCVKLAKGEVSRFERNGAPEKDRERVTLSPEEKQRRADEMKKLASEFAARASMEGFTQ